MTIAQLERQAIDATCTAEPTITRYVAGTGLSVGLVSLMQKTSHTGCGIEWLVTAIASWVGVGESGDAGAGFDDDGFDRGTYAELLAKWPSMREFMQTFELRRFGEHGAELCVNGGASEADDDSTSVYPIQRWVYTEFPWSDKPFRVMAGRVHVGTRPSWILMLPSEY